MLTQDGSTKVVTNLAYPKATGYLALAPGSYDLKVCAHADNTVCPLDPPALDLAGGTAYTVFAIVSLEGNALKSVVGVDGMAAPATDTVAPDGASNGTSNGNGLAVLLLGVAVVIGSAPPAGSQRPAPLADLPPLVPRPGPVRRSGAFPRPGPGFAACDTGHGAGCRRASSPPTRAAGRSGREGDR